MNYKYEAPILIEPLIHGDQRGYFFEPYNRETFRNKWNIEEDFVQDNESFSRRGVLRGLHYQIQQSQGKLVRVVRGSVFDVVVDLRRASPTFGEWVGAELSEENNRQFWIPPGFAHGFLVTSDSADFLYKTTDYYAPEHERSLAWNDPDVGVAWPLDAAPLLSAKDLAGKPLGECETFP